MTRTVRIQNLQPAESIQPLIVALHQIAGPPTEFKVDPQREVIVSIHDNAPMISIGKQPIAESDLPSETVLATARGAAELQERLDAMQAENQQLRVDKDILAAEVERLTSVAAEHKPAEDSELSAQLAQALADNKVLAEAYEKRFEELKVSEEKNAALKQENYDYAERIDALTNELHAIQPPPPSVNEQEAPPKPLDKMNKAELLAEAKARGVEVDEALTKAEIIAKLQA